MEKIKQQDQLKIIIVPALRRKVAILSISFVMRRTVQVDDTNKSKLL